MRTPAHAPVLRDGFVVAVVPPPYARAAYAFLALGVLLALAVSVARNGAFTGAALMLESVGAVTAIVVGIRRYGPDNRRFWSLCAAGLGTSLVAGVLTLVLPSEAASSVALIDGTYLAGYTVLVLAGLHAMPVRGRYRDWAGILDALTLAIAGATLFFYYEVEPALSGHPSFHTVVTGVVYPAYDLLLVVLLSRLATSTAPRRFPFVMICVALSSSVITDFWYATAGGDGYVWGSVSDAFWVLPMTAFGAAALHPAMKEFAAARQGDALRITWIRVFLIGFGAFSVPVVVAWIAYFRGHLVEAMPPVLVGSSLLAVAGVARTAEMVRQARNVAERAQALSTQLRESLSDRERLHDELVHTALYDPLTGLANRRLFQERLDQALERVGRPCAVMFIDLDDFKNINDSLGHVVGDLALVELARRIEANLRTEDIMARFGGDEFAVLLLEPTPEGVATLGQRLLEAVAVPMDVAGTALTLRISIGAAGSENATDKSDLLRNADIAMYEAKAAGKDQIVVFEERMRQSRLHRLDLEAELRTAIDNDELVVVYQPVVDLRDGAVDGVEALVRWRRRDGSAVPAPELIALAEDTGLILPLGRYVLRQATAQARDWSTRGIRLNMAVNVSAAQLTDPRFIEAVRRGVGVLGAGQRLVLELTESALVGSDPRHLAVLHELRALGAGIAFDDFGTGFSSLAYLKDLPVDILKLDRTFVTGLEEDSATRSIASAVLELGHALGHVVVAEGIERPEEAAALRLIGCRIGQGYLFSRPGRPEEVEPFLARWSRSRLEAARTSG